MDTNIIIDEVLKRRTWLLKENSNTQITPSLLDLHVSASGVREYALTKLYSKDVAQAHKDARIYIHDLHSAFRPYCNGNDLRIVLTDGLRFPHCRSNPASHFSSAVYQSMAFLFYSQLFFAGAQAYDYYNWFLAPVLHYDSHKPSYREVKQTLQGVVFQLNQSNRIGAQSAFTNLGLRINCPSYLKEERAVYAGEKLKETYADFEDEARTIYKALMEVMGGGDGNGAPFTFPLITTAITKDLDWNDELVDVTMKTAASTGSPYFFNLTTPYLDEKYVHAMCCHLLVSHSGGVWMAGGLGTGSNKIVTINLPQLGLRAKDEDHLIQLLEEEMEIARKALQQGNKIVKRSLDEWKILPFLKMKTIDGAPYYNFKDRRLTFGVIGLNECLQSLAGVKITSNEGMLLGRKIVQRMSELAAEFSKRDKVRYTLEQTPAESATHYLALKDAAKYRKANLQGSGKSAYYTNSTHVPYNEDTPLLGKVNIEAEYHPYFTGGTICHIWMGESEPNTDSMKNLVKKMSNTKLAYFTFSPDYSICKNEHYSKGMQSVCPECNAKIVDHISRVVGYFTKTSGWNPGKKKEYKERKRFTL